MFNISTSLCEVHQSLLQQCTPATWCCHPGVSRLGWCSSACKPLPCSSKHNDGHCGQTVLFLFNQTGGHSKKYDLCPHVQLQTVVWLFLWQFWSSGFLLAERPSKLCQYRTCFTVDIDTFVPVSSSIFTRSFAVVLGLSCTFRKQSTLISRRHNTSPSWAVWWLRGPMVFILAYYCYCLYRWTWYLQAFGNCSQGWTRLVEVYNLFWGLAWFFGIFLWCQAKRHWVWR